MTPDLNKKQIFNMVNIKYSTCTNWAKIINEITLHTVGCTPLGAAIIHCPNMVKFNNQNLDNTGIIKPNKNIT